MFQALQRVITSIVGLPSSESSTPLSASPWDDISASFKDHGPTPIDILRVKQLLIQASHHRLPIDLADAIIDFAQYWLRVTQSLESPLVVSGTGNSGQRDVLCLRAPPISTRVAWRRHPGYYAYRHAHPDSPHNPRGSIHDAAHSRVDADGAETDAAGSVQDHSKTVVDPEESEAAVLSFEPRVRHPVRQIVWRLRSHDQGFSNEEPQTRGTYNPSYTWFDAGLERLRQRPDSNDERGRLVMLPEQSLAPSRSNSSATVATKAKPAPSTSASPDTATSPNPSNDQLAPPPAIITSSSSSGSSSASPSSETDSDEPLWESIWPPEDCFDSEYMLQRNRQARREPQEHVIVWTDTDDIDPEGPEGDELHRQGQGRRTRDGRFVRMLEVGDVVTLWARARYPAWTNHVQEASVEVYFAV